jgi:hypothetical protein
MAGHELPGPVDTDFGIDAVRENSSAPVDTDFGIGAVREKTPSPHRSAPAT